MPTFLYAIGHRNGPVKIGISDNPEGRLAQFQTSCPFQIRLIHAEECESRKIAYAEESFIHRRLSNLRIHGEWFNISAIDARDHVNAVVGTGQAWRARTAAGDLP